ncbi:MAG: FAD-binding oxidoreductase [Pseudolysinimonas sp.]|uniref:FAD-binding oxidoreductase n=1 Tax=Pseudolysinimonas sp. TaxID=2680009 RepID=UPI00326416A5
MHELSGSLDGAVFEPGEAGFTEELAGFNLAVSHSPDLVVAVASTADVVAAVLYAARHGMAVRVQATGHGSEEPITDGLVISTKRLNGVTVDANAGVATIGAGARWGAVVAAAAPFGLAPITGSSPDVGVVGYLMGGGLGPLARSHGFSSDYLLGATVVTAAGDVVEATPDSEPELFWALRGGKGGLGVVVGVRVRLVAIPELYAGSLTFAAANVEAVLRGWIDWTAAAPDDVTTSVLVAKFPDLPFLPPHLRGRFLLTLRFAYAGSAREGERLAAPLRALAPVETDALGTMALTDVAQIHADPTDPAPGWGWGALLTPIDQDFATVFGDLFNPTASIPFLAIEIRHLGGRTKVDVDGGSAVGGRDAAFAIHVIGAPDPTLFAEVLPRAAAGFADAIGAWIAPKTTINYAHHFETRDDFARAWPDATFARLEKVRQTVDPHGVIAYGAG